MLYLIYSKQDDLTSSPIVRNRCSFYTCSIRKFCCCQFFFLASCFFIPNTLLSQSLPLKSEYLTTIDGLSHNIVQCILQDRQGYIWFGTNYGLNRYDGYAFKVFENIPGDSWSIACNNIISLYQDKDDLIWVGTSTSSFSSYNPRTESFTNYMLPQVQKAIDKKDSLLRINPKYVLHPVQAWIHDFEEDENGLLWLATGSGLFSFDKKMHNATYHATDDSARENVHSILKDKNKNILWLSSETGIRKFNKKTGSVKNN